MKKVIQQQQTETINLNDITDNSIVGIEWGDQERNFILKDSTKGYVSVDNSLDTNCKWSGKTKQSYVEEAVNEQNATAYVFNTTKELYKWLSE